MAKYHATQTAKTMLTNTEAIELTRRLRYALANSVCFEQALYQSATPADIACIETLIGTANHLYSDVTTEEERKTRKYLQDSIRPASVFEAV